MGWEADVRAALEARLLTAAGLPDANHRAGENRSFQPVPGEAWLRATLAFGESEPFTVPADGAWVVHTGLYFVDAFHPLDQGPGPGDTLASAVRAVFPPGTSLGTPSGVLRVTRSLRRAGRRDEDWYHVPIEIGWRVETINVL